MWEIDAAQATGPPTRETESRGLGRLRSRFAKDGVAIRQLLLHAEPGNSMRSETELLLFAASRAQLVGETIRPALEKGSVVVSDRFYDSTTVYQGFGRGLDLAFVGP